MACTPPVATRHDVPLGPYSRGRGIWLVARVRIYKRFSSVTFRIMADTRKTLCNSNIRKTLYDDILYGKPYVEPDTLEKRSRNAMACTPLVATRHDVPLESYSRGRATWLVAWVRVYKRFSSVTFRVLAGST